VTRFLQKALLVCVLTATGAQPGRAGEMVVTSFEPGTQTTLEVLPKVQVKSVVAEFLDPGDTGDGKSMAALLWRELLSAISDQSGAGVILAKAPPERRLTDMLASTYHRAAAEIAENQHSRLAIWGAVTVDGDEATVESYLTVIGGPSLASLRLMSVPPVPQIRPALEAPISGTRVNFVPLTLSRAELFARTLVARSNVTLRQEPRLEARSVRVVPVGTVLQSTDMTDGWFVVLGSHDEKAYLRATDVDVAPVCAKPTTTEPIPLRDTAGGSVAKAVATAGPDCARVVAMRYLMANRQWGLWYQVESRGKIGWVPAGMTQARFSLPAVNFIAGLYRFYLNRFDDAAREFQTFAEIAGGSESNANLATSKQLLGASRLMGPVSRHDLEAFVPLEQAVILTPFDPNAYVVRAVAGIGLEEAPPLILQDLDKALQLDRLNQSARNLLSSVITFARGNGVGLIAHRSNLRSVRSEVELLASQYRVEAAAP
jgi:hypothetical protein